MIESACRSKGWSFTLRLTTRTRTSEGRPLGLVKREDATNLYKRMHRVRVGVWQIGKADVPANPRQMIITRDFVRLSRFVRYKAFHFAISKEGAAAQLPSSVDAFVDWLRRVDCNGEGDPRCLPFHVFKSKVNTDDLDTQTGRRRFAGEHGSQSLRTDGKGLRWKRPDGPYHGREVLQIAGRELATGFHWDVSDSASGQNITTTSDVWDIGRNGHVNVYPDAHIRGGRSSRRRRMVERAKAR